MAATSATANQRSNSQGLVTGTLALYRGIANILLGDQSLPRLAFRDKVGYPDWFVGIDQTYLAGTHIPMPLVIFLVLALILGLVLHRTTFGRWVYALRRTGWHNYSLFMRDDGLLFGYFETSVDFQTARAGMEKEEVNQRWQEFMKPYFEALGGSRPDEAMLELEEVFRLD